MVIVIIVLVVVLLAFTMGAVLWLARPGSPPAGPPSPAPQTQPGDEAQQRAAQAHGTELLERRIALDGRRGPLQGDYELDSRLEQLEDQVRRGEISEEDFEAEKIRLLGG